MRDVEVATRAGEQFNRISSAQLRELGASRGWVHRRVAAGRLVRIEPNVFAVPPVDFEDDRGRWMGATLIGPACKLSHLSAAVAWGVLSFEGRLTTVSRPGSGGVERVGRVCVHRSDRLEDECTAHHGIPITRIERTLIDIAGAVSDPTLARAVRESIRLGLTTLAAIADAVARHPGARGTKALRRTLARYSGLPLDRARSGAEVRAMEILRDARRPLPSLNPKIAGERPDLVWHTARVIIEIDGGPFHLDRGEDERKSGVWERAGWTVLRIPSDDVYSHPSRLLALVDANVGDVPVDEDERDVR